MSTFFGIAISGKILMAISMKGAIRQVCEGRSLTLVDAKSVFDQIMRGEATDAQIGAFVTALKMKGEAIPEIQGAVQSMREVVAPVKYGGDADVLDIVGTGGDGKSSFNVSTASAIVAAGAGCVVAKHGNRGVSSSSGSADVLRELGVNIETSPKRNSEILSKIGLAFMFAPLHHPAMRYAAGPRGEIGIRTIFNIVGPLTNPAQAGTYLLGAYSADLARDLAYVLAGVGTKTAMVVHGMGHDEATLTGYTTLFEVRHLRPIEIRRLEPAQLNLGRWHESELTVSGAAESAEVIMGILEGREKGARFETVLFNAGLGIFANGQTTSIRDGIESARLSIEDGSAKMALDLLVMETNRK